MEEFKCFLLLLIHPKWCFKWNLKPFYSFLSEIYFLNYCEKCSLRSQGFSGESEDPQGWPPGPRGNGALVGNHCTTRVGDAGLQIKLSMIQIEVVPIWLSISVWFTFQQWDRVVDGDFNIILKSQFLLTFWSLLLSFDKFSISFDQFWSFRYISDI